MEPGLARRNSISEEETAAKRQKTQHASPGSCTLAQKEVLGCDDLICHILTFLPVVDKCRPDGSSMVAKNWKECCNRSAAWHSIQGDDDEKFLRTGKAPGPTVRLRMLLPRLGASMRSFNFNFFRPHQRDDGSCDEIFHELVKQCKQLRTLRHQKTNPRLRYAAEELRFLQTLSISSNEKDVTDAQLLAALEKLGGNLTSLTLSRPDPRLLHWIPTFPQLALPDLGKLCPKLQGFSGPVNDVVLESLSDAKDLRRLYLVPAGRSTYGMQCLLQSSGQKLTKLVIGTVYGPHKTEWLDYVVLFKELTVCSVLQRLVLYRAGSIGDTVSTEQFADFLSATSQSLKDVDFGNSINFTDE
jgi:hypothetical protein